MSVLLEVDEAFAFDYLAILMVKLDHGLDVQTEVWGVEAMLARQLKDTSAILASGAFKKLLKANHDTFEAIEKAHRDEIKASNVQLVNHERFEAKQALQRRFWPKEKLRERKTALDKRR